MSKGNPEVVLVNKKKDIALLDESAYALWQGDTEILLKGLPKDKKFDLVVTSPPYNIGKIYEKKKKLDEYITWQGKIIDLIIPHVKDTGSICWQVGNYVENGQIIPLDIELAPAFKKHNLQMRNRIIWHFGHGLHNKKRFSGRYEVVLWYTKSDSYLFNLDNVRIPSKYPGKRYSKGPNVGKYSSNPLGKNPDDVWDIPNVKSNHVEKTSHPCQFPVGLIERLILALTKECDVVFDPFAGVGSAGVAAAIHNRHFLGSEIQSEYTHIAQRRMLDALAGIPKYRPHDRPLYDHRKSNLSKYPNIGEQNGIRNLST